MGIFERKLDSFCGPMDEHVCVCVLCMCVLCDVYMCVQVHTSVNTHTEALYRCSLPISLRQGLSLSQKLITSARRLEVSSGTWLPLPQHCGCSHSSRGCWGLRLRSSGFQGKALTVPSPHPHFVLETKSFPVAWAPQSGCAGR